MADKNNLPKDVEEQIQSLASDVYIQVEEKLTNLISTAVQAELSKNSDQQSKALSEKEQSLQNDFSNKQQIQIKEIELLKKELAEKKADEEAAKQNFQVELTQKTINYTESIESLEKQLAGLKQENAKTTTDKESNDKKLEEKLLEAEQKLDGRNHEVDGLNGRIMVLTEQEQSLTQDLNKAKEELKAMSAKQDADINEAKKQASASSQKEIDGFAEKLKQSQEEVVKVKAEAAQGADKAVKELQEQLTQLTAQAKKDQDSKSEIQQQLAELQKTVDTEKDTLKQKDEAHSVEVAKLTEQIEADKKRHSEELQAEKSGNEEAKTLQKTAQDAIIDLDKANKELTKQIEAEKGDLKRFEYEVTKLTEQLKVAQDGQAAIQQRFDSNRDKQEVENTKVRETIKFLRDENHQLLTASEEIKTQYTDQISELEHKVTEYRLKFEYAQKQLAKT